jgi:hypothetical protein
MSNADTIWVSAKNLQVSDKVMALLMFRYAKTLERQIEQIDRAVANTPPSPDFNQAIRDVEIERPIA